MTDESRPTLGYVLPTYQRSSGEHLAHVPKLLEQLSRHCDVEVVIWDCRDEPALPGVTSIHSLQSTGSWARYQELKRHVRARRAAGVRRWFVRSAPLPALAVQAGGGECAFWVCGAVRQPSSLRDRVNHAIFGLACARVSKIVTAPGMEAYNEAELGLPRSKTLLLNNDIDLSRWRPLDETERLAVRARLGWPVDRPVLLYVHRLATLRGAGALLPTLELSYARGFDPLVVAVGGPGDLSEPLAAYAASHPDRLVLAGPQPNEELPSYYGAADLFLMPSLGEGFPRVVLEAMATGTPMVATDVGVTRQILPPDLADGLVVPPQQYDAFAARVVELLGDAAQRETMRQQFLSRVVEFGVERVAEDYRKVLLADG